MYAKNATKIVKHAMVVPLQTAQVVIILVFYHLENVKDVIHLAKLVMGWKKQIVPAAQLKNS